MYLGCKSRVERDSTGDGNNPHLTPQARRRSNPGRRRVAREATTTRERRRERTRRGAAGTATIGPGSEDGRDGIKASAEPDEGGQVSLRQPAF